MNVDKLKKIIYKNRFALLLITISALLISANYQPGTILSGWDTLHPEFNFLGYFKRIFFGVWQEHQGLGTLATQAHASEIARMFIYYPISLVLPDSFLRYGYFFLTIILGPLGIYYFIREKVFRSKTLSAEICSFLGGLFYLLNLGTLQHFYVPFEMFATHFASLPWLFLLAVNYLENKSAKTLLLFSIISFLSASIAHTSTLWFAFLGGFFVFLTTFCLLRRGYRSNLKGLLIILITFLLVNSFWLFPNLYFLVNQGDSVSNSKIHSLFSEEAFAQNQSFGNIKDVLIFKNFLFNWGEYVRGSKFDFLLNEWILHLKNPVVLFLGYLFSFISIAGIIYSIAKKNVVAISLLSVLFVSLFFWFNSNPPLGFIYNFLRENVPLFSEAFRFPFTKFSIFLVFCASVYFSFGLNFIIKLISRFKSSTFFPRSIKLKWKNEERHPPNKFRGFKKVLDKENKILLYYVLFITLTATIYYMLPAFKGNFISPSMKVKIPNHYFQMFEWFDKEPMGRIANLPIHSFWGWTYYDWYYQGAGFSWFGINQPLLDREFDRWGRFNEGYYREMSQAVYSRNQALFEGVIKKYDISYLFIDRSVIAPGPGNDPRVLFVNEISEMLNKSSLLNDGPDFESISIYKTKDQSDPVFLLENAQEVSPVANVMYEDFAFEKYGDYIASNNSGLSYPLKSIIDNQNRLLLEPQFSQNGLLFPIGEKSNTNAPPFEKVESNQPANLYIVKSQKTLKILLYLKYPNAQLPRPLEVSLPSAEKEFILSINHKYNFRIGGLEENIPFLLGQVNLNIAGENPIAIYPSKPDKINNPDILSLDYSLFSCGKYDKTPVFGLDPIDSNSFSFFANHAQACIRFPVEQALDINALGKGSQTLLSIQFDFDGDNQANLCVVRKDNPNCIYYFSKNLEANVNPEPNLSQYFSVENEDLKNLEVKIFLDSTDLTSSKRVKYENISLGLTSPLSQTQVTKLQLDRFARENSSGSDFSEILIPFSGNRDLSRDITSLPKTGGDCPAINPRGPAPSSREVVKDEISDFIRYSSDEGSFCDHFSYQGLPSNQGYLIAIKSRNVKGLPIRLCAANLISKRCDIYTHLPKNEDFKTDIYLLPPMREGAGFDININNFAIKKIPSVNDLASINVIPIPYDYLSQIEQGTSVPIKSKRSGVDSFSHPNSSLYTASFSGSKDKTLVLSQSYDKGWVAYEVPSINKLTEIFPFIFGKPIDGHVMINNWANGWTIQQTTNNKQQTTIVIVYLPQYLEYVGLILTSGTIIVIAFLYRKRNGI